MKNLLILTFLIISVSLLGQIVSPFGNLRHSSVDPEGMLHLRFDALPNHADYSLNYRYDGDWLSADLQHLGDDVLESLVPYDFGQRLSYSPHFRIEMAEYALANLYIPRLDSPDFPPPLSYMIKIDDDPSDDLIGATNPDLDIAANYVAIYENQLFRAIENHSGSYSLAQSLTQYNLYMSLIVNPEANTEIYAYAMVYTFNIPGLISPGLYKVGVDLNNPTLQRLGNIQSTVHEGILHMSCDMDLLISDPDFGAWPNDINTLMMEDVTLSLAIDLITMEPELTQGDISTLGAVDFTELVYEVSQNTIPTLKVVDFDPYNGDLELLYLDNEGDFPLAATVYLPNDQGGFTQMDMNPIYNPDGSITFYETGGQNIKFVVSDNLIDYVELYSPTVSNQDQVANLPMDISIQMPNPLNRSLPSHELEIKNLQDSEAIISLYNLRGQKLAQIATLTSPEESERILLRSPDYAHLSAGIYFIRIQQGGRSSAKKFSIIN